MPEQTKKDKGKAIQENRFHPRKETVLRGLAVLIFLGIASCASTSAFYYTPLTKAAVDNDLQKVQSLLSHGADPNQPDRLGQTPLVLASRHGYDDIVKVLLAHKADPNLTGVAPLYNGSPLIAALDSRTPDVIKDLLDHGAFVNQYTAFGTTPLLFSIENLDPTIVEFLLKHGADPNQNSIALWYHGSPLRDAVGHASVQKVRILLTYGAKPHLSDININNPSNAQLEAINLIRAALHLPIIITPKTLHQQAQDALDKGDSRKAFRIYWALLRKLPNDTTINVAYDDYKSAIDISKKLKRSLHASETYRKEMVIALMIVREAKSPEDYKHARNHFVAASRLAPWMPQPYEALGHMEEALKDYSAAAQYYRLYLLANPRVRDARAIRDHIYELTYKAGNDQGSP